MIFALLLLLIGGPAEDHPSFHPCLHGNHVGYDDAGRWWDCTLTNHDQPRRPTR